MWPGVGAVLTGAFDLVTQARIPVRNASLYVGLLGLLSMGPALIAIVADPGFDVEAFVPGQGVGRQGIDIAALYLLFFALVAVALESQIIGLAIVGGARTGRPLRLSEGLRRSRTVFWRMFRATAMLAVLEFVLNQLILAAATSIFGSDTDVPTVGTSLLVGVILAPFVYVAVGIVLGDVGSIESIRRSVRLARARFRLALVLSLFSVVANYLLLFAASAGLDLAARVLGSVQRRVRLARPDDRQRICRGRRPDPARPVRRLDPGVHGRRADLGQPGRRVPGADRLLGRARPCARRASVWAPATDARLAEPADDGRDRDRARAGRWVADGPPRLISRSRAASSRSSSIPRWWASSWMTVIRTSSARSPGSGKSSSSGIRKRLILFGKGTRSAPQAVRGVPS